MNMTSAYPPNLEAYLDLPVKLTVELGACRKSTQDILHWSTGTVVVLDSKSGGPVDLYVERNLVARGEIVMSDQSLAIKVTEIFSAPVRFTN